MIQKPKNTTHSNFSTGDLLVVNIAAQLASRWQINGVVFKNEGMPWTDKNRMVSIEV